MKKKDIHLKISDMYYEYDTFTSWLETNAKKNLLQTFHLYYLMQNYKPDKHDKHFIIVTLKNYDNQLMLSVSKLGQFANILWN